MSDVSTAEFVSRPDEHLDPRVAANYDASVADRFSAASIDPAVALLAEFAGGGTAVEFAIGTGRLALPLARAGVAVMGIDFSEPMVAELLKKQAAEGIAVTIGDMTTTRVCDDATVVYLVFNTIQNLRTQRLQTACFRNAAAHLAPGGRFVIENMMPRLERLSAGERFVPFDVSPTHLGFDEYADRSEQILISHHYFITGDRVRRIAGVFRYVWPSELDLMAELAGMSLEGRFADWTRAPFSSDSTSHVSVYRKP